ncbi:MAG: ABC transporter ATP-binding protein [Chloroflexota bacterium]
MEANILEVRHLTTQFLTKRGVVKAVDDLSFGLKKGECLSLVGESGCGKTTAALSILRLVDCPPGKIIGGEVLYHGEDLLRLTGARLREIRGNRIAMIFQDPQSSLNPVFTVGDQIAEPIRLHMNLSKVEAQKRAAELMAQVGIPRAVDRIKDYPHQFSGGMRQRVMIAIALSCDPGILIADEPVTALDTTVKAQILDILLQIKKMRQMTILFITHDLASVRSLADRVVVMYGGRLVETGSTTQILNEPRHPYTRGLIGCRPDVSLGKRRLTSIPGSIPSLIDPPPGCIFHPRCERKLPVCSELRPEATIISEGHTVVCHLYHRTEP